MRGRWCPALALLAGCAVGCGPVDEGETGAEPVAYTHCQLDGVIEVCLERDSYARGASLPYSLTNLGEERAYEDRCTGTVEGRREADDTWSASYGFQRLCDNWADEADVREHMVLLEPGEPVTGSLVVSSQAYGGEWRALLGVLDRNAEPLGAFSSPVFTVTVD